MCALLYKLKGPLPTERDSETGHYQWWQIIHWSCHILSSLVSFILTCLFHSGYRLLSAHLRTSFPACNALWIIVALLSAYLMFSSWIGYFLAFYLFHISPYIGNSSNNCFYLNIHAFWFPQTINNTAICFVQKLFQFISHLIFLLCTYQSTQTI